jgi:putative ABC transport system permease protein
MRIRGSLISAAQGFRYARGTMALAFVILTLAMAAGTTTFSVVDGVAFRPLPYASPRELISIAMPGPQEGTLVPIPPGEFFSLRDRTQVFASIGASRPAAPVQFAGEMLVTRSVTPDLFDVLGVKAIAGRLFAAVDAAPAGPRPAVLSHQTWMRHFGGDRGVIGSTVAFGAEPLQIVGVLPQGVWHPMELNPPAVYVPYVATDAERANNRARVMTVVARLRIGMSVDQARADVLRIVTSPVVVQSLNDRVVGGSQRWLLLLLAAVSLVLLIACVNVATLLLARATTRSQEFAVRASLGEPRSSLVGSLLLEGLILAFVSSSAAVLASFWGVEAAKAALPAGMLTRVSTIAVNGRVMAVTIGVASFCAIAFSAAPAWLATRFNLLSVMKSAGGPVVGGRRVDRSLAAFLVTEVSVVCVLLVAATLVVRSFVEVTATDLGFVRHDTATIPFVREATATTEASRHSEGATLRNQLLSAAKSVPGVIDAAIAVNGSVPMSGMSVRYSLVIPNFGEALGDDMFETRVVTPEYFNVMGMQLVSGRLLERGDHAGAPRVMLMNDAAARRFFGGKDPVGQVVPFRGPTTIVGVLKGVRFDGPEGAIRPEMYLPADQEFMRLPRDFGTVVVRTNGRTREVGAAVREAIRTVLGAEPGNVEVVDDFFRNLTAGRRFNASVMGVLGLIGVAIGVAGVYGTMQFQVTRRFRDIGLRLALGALPAQVRRSVLAASLRHVAAGVTLGLVAAWAISSAFQSVVFGITPTDASVYLQVAAAVVVVGLLAAWLPAKRAAGLDPVDALRRD